MNNPMGEIKRSLCDERGSVTIEAGLYFVVFFVLCALLVDFSAVFLNKRLPRASNLFAGQRGARKIR
ncbi:hypothetical protein UA70_24320, partial [Raoultella planticola]